MDLPSFIKTCPEIKVQMYADDVKIYATYNKVNEEVVQLALKKPIMELNEWALNWELSVNLSKSSVFHLGGGAPGNYEINGVQLKQRHAIKDLGVHISVNLKFSNHIK
uniref:Reverse transcriptase domain-containing protein n=1 Tax=Haemonchus contortus TaxID=6289 RepID=A0A7I4Z2B1_HAECO